MTGEDPWSSWAADWRAAPQDLPDFDALERTIRTRRRRGLARSIIEIATSLGVGGICVWAIGSGEPAGIITGLAGLAFCLFGLAVAIGGKHVPGALETRTVAGALGWEITAARASIRTSIGGLMIAAGALLFLLVCVIVYWQADILHRPIVAAWLLGGGALAIASGAGSLVMLRRRKARLLTLENLLTDLKDEA